MKLNLKWFFTLLTAFFVQLSFAQEKTVTGTVMEDGFPLPGVSIVVKGTTMGTQTDFDGKYSIQVKTGETLLFSFIGMDTVTQTVGESNTINVTMVTSDSQLEEVIVMAYGQVKKKNEVTGSAVKVDGSVIENTPLVSADQALQGRVAGLQMATTSGTPGSAQEIRIRGISGIGGDLEPLFVIDGMPMINSNMGQDGLSTLSPLSSINSSDIESITVLKDATATAPYGARGAAGVIVITTKKGKSGGTRFALTTTAGIQNRAVRGLQMANGAQKEELFLESLFNDYGVAQGFTKDQTYNFYTANPGLLPNATASAAFNNLNAWKAAGSQDYDWAGKLTNKNALYYNLDFSAQGGDEKSNFYSSLGYNKTESIAFGSDFRRVTGNLAYDTKLTDKFRFKTNIRIANTKQNGIMENGSYFSNPMLTQYFMSPWYNPYNANGSYNTNVGSLHNTLYTISNNKNVTDLTRLMGSFGVDYEIAKGLRWNSTANLDFNLSDHNYYANPYHGDGVTPQGYAENIINKNFNYVIQNSLDYAFGFGKNKFNVKALMEYQKNKFTSLYGYGEKLAPGFDMLGNTSANWDASNTYNDWAQLSYTAMVNYNYDGKYLIDGSFRREASSKFNPENRWGNFWALGGAWNIMNEDFMENVNFIDLLRIRGSYGTTGNNGIAINSYQSLLGTSSYGGQMSYELGQLPAIITWESQAKTDVGIDFGVLNNRIAGSVAFYNSKSSDLLFVNNPITSTTGYTTKAINSGAMRNRGWEFELDIDVVRTENFNFNISGNFATVNNKILSMPYDAIQGEPMEIVSSTRIIKEGQPLYAWNMRKYAGVDSQTGQALYYINGHDGATTTNYGDAAVALQGESALPKYTGGLTLHFDIYNFFIDGTFYYSGGNKIYEDWATYTNNTGNRSYTYNYGTPILDRWQQPGDVTNVPKVISTTSTSEQVSTRFLHDGDFIRLRDVAIGYKFPSELLRNTHIDGVTVSVRGTNLWTWVKDNDLKYDPEVRADGFTNLANPPIKQVSLSANIKF
ncbi:SusC/RagA family TonB-linked outer membrane protein [Flavobacterium agricola]|uniref:SusC/RagA family TonB-linked outer membrane protein n=1 Tax=Flavobacterium agricola TaxID=2870839 RepID=A0ABY6LW54_9FLAO|nr:SusC/RagA family TonB-linked outer membrane protein [Flavobacterium agricola]UYW00559.1 SusC/RagA family TonB-linked outer membrane protein [Flavobacterium agricola]